MVTAVSANYHKTSQNPPTLSIQNKQPTHVPPNEHICTCTLKNQGKGHFFSQIPSLQKMSIKLTPQLSIKMSTLYEIPVYQI